MHILVIEATGLAGSFTKSVPISDQAATDPARRGNIIREHTPAGGKVNSWRVTHTSAEHGERIIAQSSMKTAISQTVPGVADSIHDRAHFGEVIAFTPGMVTADLNIERDYHDDNEREDAPDPFDLSAPKTLADADLINFEPTAGQVKIAEALSLQHLNRQEAFQIGVEHATAALETNSVMADFQTPFGDGGNGMDTSLRDAYEDGYNSVINYCLTDDQRAKLHGYDSIVVAEHDARALTDEFEKPVWAVDRGGSVRPRYATFEGYKVGDYVSKGFNGDIYPLGRIIGLGGQGDQVIGWRIIVVELPNGKEVKFWRRKTSDSWKEGGVDGTFGLVRGLHNARNPSF